jgi:hypothetical protein
MGTTPRGLTPLLCPLPHPTPPMVGCGFDVAVCGKIRTARRARSVLIMSSGGAFARVPTRAPSAYQQGPRARGRWRSLSFRLAVQVALWTVVWFATSIFMTIFNSRSHALFTSPHSGW